MKEEKGLKKKLHWFKERDKLATEMGLLVLGYADLCAPYDQKGEVVPPVYVQRFKEHYEGILRRYADLVKEFHYEKHFTA